MNYTPVTGWYYKNANDRTPSWTGVQYLYNFLVNNKGAGPSAETVGLREAAEGDIIQLGSSGVFYHSLFVIKTGETPYKTIINAHTSDSYMRPLSSYYFEEYRVLHIKNDC